MSPSWHDVHCVDYVMWHDQRQSSQVYSPVLSTDIVL